MNDIWQGNNLNLDGSRVIDRRIYVDREVFAAEQKRIFAKTWQWVAHDSELPNAGDFITATVAGRPVIVSRDNKGKVYAFLNTCTHRGAALAVAPRGNAPGGFTCYYHAWSFDNAGKFLSAPLDTAYGANLKKACYDAPGVRSEIFAGNIFVSLDPNIEPLEAFLGEVAPCLRRVTGEHEALGRVRWTLEGNWKLWHENFRDNYHPMFTHQMIGIGYQGVTIEGANRALSNGHSLMEFPQQYNPAGLPRAIRKVTGREFEMPPPSAPPAPGNDGKNMIVAIFPNLDLQHSPRLRLQNSPQALGHDLLQVVHPISPERAVVEIVVFGRKGEPDDVRSLRLAGTLDGQAASGKISGDDSEAVRRCAMGFGTVNEVGWSNMDRGQEPGNAGGKNDEYSLRGFYVAYKKFMGDALTAPRLARAVEA